MNGRGSALPFFLSEALFKAQGETYNSAAGALIMRFVGEIAIVVVVIAILYVPWAVLIHSALRLWGIPSEIWPSKGSGVTNERLLRKLGKQRFIIVEGVLLWGWPILAALKISHYLAIQYLGAPHDSGPLIVDLSLLIFELLLWSLVGYYFGLKRWNKSSR